MQGEMEALYSTDRSEFPTHLLPSVTQSHTHTVQFYTRPSDLGISGQGFACTYIGVDGKNEVLNSMTSLKQRTYIS